MPHSPLTIHPSPFKHHHSPLTIIHPSPFTLRHSIASFQPSPFNLEPSISCLHMNYKLCYAHPHPHLALTQTYKPLPHSPNHLSPHPLSPLSPLSTPPTPLSTPPTPLHLTHPRRVLHRVPPRASLHLRLLQPGLHGAPVGAGRGVQTHAIHRCRTHRYGWCCGCC